MLRHLQASLFALTADHSTPSSEDRPANQAASQASEEEPTTIAGCGLTFCAWCLRSTTHRNSRSCGCWRRTLAESLASTLRDFNSPSGLRVSLKLVATNSSPSSWLLKTSAHHTDESESGSSGDWPTPLESDDHAKVRKRGNPNLPATVMWPTARASDGPKGGPNQRGSKGDLMLSSAVQNWPTAMARANKDCPAERERKSPTLESAAKMWPTPVVPNGGRQPKGGYMSLTGQTPDGKKRQVDLLFAVKEWPTPTVHGNTNRKGATKKAGDGLRTAAVNSWSTPTRATTGACAPAKNSRPLSEQVGLHDQANRSTNGRNPESPSTGEQVSRFRYSMKIEGVGEVLMEWLVKCVARLNPRWVCQLMGFPSDWLDDVEWPPSKPSATRSSRNARKS